MREDDRIGVDGRTYIFKSYLEKTKATNGQDDPGRRRQSGSLGRRWPPAWAASAATIVNAAVFGAGKAMDIFSVALAVAGFMRRMVGENAMKSVFLPIFPAPVPARSAQESLGSGVGHHQSHRCSFPCSSARPAFFWPRAVIRFLFPGFAAKGFSAEAVRMTRILFPCLFLGTLAAMMATYLQAFNRFAAADASTLVFALGSILGMLPAPARQRLLRPGLRHAVRRPAADPFPAAFPAEDLPPAGAGILLPAGPSRSTAPSAANTSPSCRRSGLGAFLSQSADAGRKIPGLFPAPAARYPTCISPWKSSACPLPWSPAPIDQVVCKDFSEHTALFDNDKTKKLFIDGMRINLFLLAPLSILIIVLANPLVSLLLERFHFSALAVASTALALQFYAIGLIGWGIHSLTTRIFAARLEKRTTDVARFFHADLPRAAGRLAGHDAAAVSPASPWPLRFPISLSPWSASP